MTSAEQKFTIKNVYVFSGHDFQHGDVEVTRGTITSVSFQPSQQIDEQGAIFDGRSKYLIPGLIDTHIHLSSNASELRYKMAKFGVTAALDMACWPSSSWKPYASNTPEYTTRTDKQSANEPEPAATDFRSAGVPATVPGSNHAKIPGLGQYAIDVLAEASSEDITMAAKSWVEARVAEGSQYIKLVADTPIGPSQALLNALVSAAHNAGKLVVTHAARKQAFEMAVASGTDVVTHVPMDGVMDDATAAELAHGMRALDGAQKRICVPTLSVCKAMCAWRGPPLEYKNAVDSVKKLVQAGVPILAGTDANNLPPGVGPAPIVHGESMWAEMQMLSADVGLAPVEVLNAATCMVDRYFGIALEDRGKIEVGRKADLVLLSSDPFEQAWDPEIITNVWIGGKQVEMG